MTRYCFPKPILIIFDRVLDNKKYIRIQTRFPDALDTKSCGEVQIEVQISVRLYVLNALLFRLHAETYLILPDLVLLPSPPSEKCSYVISD